MNKMENALKEPKECFKKNSTDGKSEDYYGEILNMKSSDKIDSLIDCIHEFVKQTNQKGGGITSSQLRNIFTKVKQVKKVQDLKLLRPTLVYTLARQSNKGAKQMIALFDDLIKKVENDSQLKSFQMFLEAVVAYHKYEEENKPKQQK